MTAIVFGAFLRGPDIILVHMAAIITESAEGMAGRRLSDLWDEEKQRAGVFVDHVAGVGPEEPQVADTGRIRGGSESLARRTGSQAIARSGRVGIGRAVHLDDVAALRHGVR